jgi:glutamine amidotransferase
MKVAVIDYGMGNLGSVCRALTKLGAAAFIADQPGQLDSAQQILLPGVGSFGDGMKNLVRGGWVDAIQNAVASAKPLLGICLGMQLLASRGTEGGICDGLDLIPGEVKRLDEFGCTLRIPHVGWNNIRLTGTSGPLFGAIPAGTDFYFVHSFAFQTAMKNDVLAEVDYGTEVTAAVGRGNVFGTQFHPEKSSKAGFRLLKNFLNLK